MSFSAPASVADGVLWQKMAFLCARFGSSLPAHIQVSRRIIKLYSYAKVKRRITAQYVILCARFGSSLPAHIQVSRRVIKFYSYAKAGKRITAQYVISCARFGS